MDRYGPRNYVKISGDKVSYYYRAKKGGPLIFEYSARVVSVMRVGSDDYRFEIEGPYSTYYYEYNGDWKGYLTFYWYEDGEWHTSVGSSLSKVYAAPAKVKGVVSSKVGKKSVTLRWSKAKNAKYYQIYKVTRTYKSGGKTKYKYKKVGNTKKRTYKIKGLRPGKAYKFRIRAVNGTKKGKMSKIEKVRTKVSP